MRGMPGVGLAALGLAGACALVVLALVDPASSALFPRCPFFWATGLHCPGCGVQRALHALLQGRLAVALGHNALAVAYLPACAAALAVRLARPSLARRLARRVPPLGYRLLAASVVAFWLLRNLPFAPFSWLAP